MVAPVRAARDTGPRVHTSTGDAVGPGSYETCIPLGRKLHASAAPFGSVAARGPAAEHQRAGGAAVPEAVASCSSDAAPSERITGAGVVGRTKCAARCHPSSSFATRLDRFATARDAAAMPGCAPAVPATHERRMRVHRRATPRHCVRPCDSNRFHQLQARRLRDGSVRAAMPTAGRRTAERTRPPGGPALPRAK